MTGAHSQTFKAARVTVAPDRSRQVVSERNTFPRMTSLCWGEGENGGVAVGGTKALCSIKPTAGLFFLHTSFLREHSVFCWIKLHLKLIMNLIRAMRKT